MKKIVENLKDCSIQWKLNFMVGLSAVMMGILGASGLIGAWELNQQIKKLYQVLLEYENTIGEEVYIFLKPVEDTDWTVGVSVPKTEILNTSCFCQHFF